MSPSGGRSGRSGGRSGGRPNRARTPRGRSLVGERFAVEVTGFGHGGIGVARLGEDAGASAGTVVLVRHALPGERVVALVTDGEEGSRFLRADAVEVLEASPDRVAPPCPLAGPGSDRCGGCDLQHADLAAQRRLKGEVVAEQLRRTAGIERSLVAEALPGDDTGLGYRSRMRYHRLPDGRLGLRASRSDRLVAVPTCPIQAPGAVVVVDGEPPVEPVVVEEVRGRRYAVAADGFWQVHTAAPDRLVELVTAYAGVRAGDTVLDLYAGVGLFTAFLAEAAGERGSVDAVEGDATAVEHARANLADLPAVRVHRGSVDRVLARDQVPARCDVAVLDPPREGAKRAVVEQVAARAPRTVVLVGCDPAAFARDVALFAEAGYAVEDLVALDLFPMTHHVEAVARLVRSGSGLR